MIPLRFNLDSGCNRDLAMSVLEIICLTYSSLEVITIDAGTLLAAADPQRRSVGPTENPCE